MGNEINIIKIITDKDLRFLFLESKGLYKHVGDEEMIKRIYRAKMSNASMERKLIAHHVSPILKYLPVGNSKELGATKSFGESPVFTRYFQSKWNLDISPICICLCISSSLSYPFNVRAKTPRVLKLLRISISICTSLGFADFMESAWMAQTMKRSLDLAEKEVSIFGETRDLFETSKDLTESMKNMADILIDEYRYEYKDEYELIPGACEDSFDDEEEG